MQLRDANAIIASLVTTYQAAKAAEGEINIPGRIVSMLQSISILAKTGLIVSLREMPLSIESNESDMSVVERKSDASRVSAESR